MLSVYFIAGQKMNGKDESILPILTLMIRLYRNSESPSPKGFTVQMILLNAYGKRNYFLMMDLVLVKKG